MGTQSPQMAVDRQLSPYVYRPTKRTRQTIKPHGFKVGNREGDPRYLTDKNRIDIMASYLKRGAYSVDTKVRVFFSPWV